MICTTLCYIEKDDAYLMLHRVSKKNDVNAGKWIGPGGHFEEGESPEECLIREVKEETGLTLTSYRLRGVVTFLSPKDETDHMFLYTADGFEGKLTDCNEGVLRWVKKTDLDELELWEGDRIFLRLLNETDDFFTLKLVYDEEDRLIQTTLNGRPL